MRKHKLAFIDLETTGLNVMEHEILDIGCVLTDPDLKIIEEFTIKIKPEHLENADPVSLKVNHYKEEDWLEAITLKEAIKIFSEKVKSAIMIGHNVAFDAGFLDVAFLKTNIQNTLHYHKLDTVSMSWAKLHREEDVDHFSLHELCTRFGIKNENPHTGLGDARATYELYKKLLEL